MAGTVLQQLRIVFSANTTSLQNGAKQATSALKGAQQQAEKTGGTFSQLAQKSVALGKAFIAMKAVQATVRYMKEASAAYHEGAVQLTKLTTVMRTTMGASEGMVKSVQQVMKNEEKLGVISEGVQTAGAQELATYLGTSDALKQLIPVLNDVTAQQYGLEASSSGIVSIATMMGKVMMGQTSALSRYGYTFTEAQEQILKYGTEAERAAVLTDVVGESVGRMNHALGQTTSGSLAQLSNKFASVKSALGEAFQPIQAIVLPLLHAFADALLWVVEKLSIFTNWLGKVFGVNTKTASSAAAVAESSEDAAEGIEKQSGSARKAAKENKKLLSTLDELNELNKESAKSGGGGGGSSVDQVNLVDAEQEVDRLTDALDRLEETSQNVSLTINDWDALISASGTVDALKNAVKRLNEQTKDAVTHFRNLNTNLNKLNDNQVTMLQNLANAAKYLKDEADGANTNTGKLVETLKAFVEANVPAEGGNALDGIADQAHGAHLAMEELIRSMRDYRDMQVEWRDTSLNTIQEVLSEWSSLHISLLSQIQQRSTEEQLAQLLLLQSVMETCVSIHDQWSRLMITSGTIWEQIRAQVESAQIDSALSVTTGVALMLVAWKAMQASHNNTWNSLKQKAEQTTSGIAATAQTRWGQMTSAMQQQMDGVRNSIESVRQSLNALLSTSGTITIAVNASSSSTGRNGGGYRADYDSGGTRGGGGSRPMPQYGIGTVTAGPEVALIGEAGTEAVVPLEGTNAKRFAQRHPNLIQRMAEIWGVKFQNMVPMANGGIVSRNGGNFASHQQSEYGSSMAEDFAEALRKVIQEARTGRSGDESRPLTLLVDGVPLITTLIGAIRDYERATGLQVLASK